MSTPPEEVKNEYLTVQHIIIKMKSIKIMVSGFGIVILGLVLKSYSLIADIIITFIYISGFIMFALGGFITTLNSVSECLKQNNDVDDD